MSDPMKPSSKILIYLGSIAVHADELTSKDGHPFDLITTRGLLDDPELKAWIKSMTKLALLPVKR